MDFLKLAQARYSCRKLSGDPIPQEQLDRILEAARSAPTAKDLQAYRLFVIRGDEGAEKIKQTTRCDFGAKTFVALGAVESEAWVRPFDGRNFADVDAGIVGAHILLQAQAEGLGCTWVGWFDTEKFRALFPETADCVIVGLFPLGKPEMGPGPRHAERRPLSEMVKEL